MKLYLHYDGVRGPDHTFVWQSGGAPAQQITGRSLAGAMAGFVDSYNGKYGQGAYDGGRLFSVIRCVYITVSFFRCETSCVYLEYIGKGGDRRCRVPAGYLLAFGTGTSSRRNPALATLYNSR